MTFTKEQIDKMLWDAHFARRSIMGEGVLSDVCCHVKTLAAEVERLRALVFEAYVAGFQRSGEGWNGEYPGDVTADDLKNDFTNWLSGDDK